MISWYPQQVLSIVFHGFSMFFFSNFEIITASPLGSWQVGVQTLTPHDPIQEHLRVDNLSGRQIRKTHRDEELLKNIAQEELAKQQASY